MKSTFILYGRLMKHIFRSPDTIITVALMPIAMMLMFVFVFGGAVKSSIGTDINYVNFQLPGILVMVIASGIAYTTMRILMDRLGGISERFNSMPISRSSVLWAHVLTSVVSNLLALLLVFIVAFLIGFRPEAGILEWMGVIGILIILTLALTWISVIPGLKAKSYETAGAYAYPLMFLPFLSSAFVPTETMPKVLRIFAENQPITSIVETLRSLLNSQPVGNNIWIALIWCGGIIIVAYFFAIKIYRGARN